MITLNKKKDKDFLVLNFSDLHLRNKSWDENTTPKKLCIHIMTTLINEVKPDLITITGDLSSSHQFNAYCRLADFLDSFDTPWSVVWGNHDNQGGPEPIIEIEKVFSTHKNFVYEPGDPSLGHGNFVIGIEEEGCPLEALIMMDSHAKIRYMDEEGNEQTIYDKLKPEQIKWYREQVAMLKAKGYKESALLLHIPIFAYKEAFCSAILKGLDPKEIRFDESSNPVFWNKGYEGCHGVMHGKIRPHPYDEGMFDAILEEDFTKTILCGHDHKNNFTVKHKGVRFSYTTRTGGSRYLYPNLVGGAVIKITSDGVEDVIQKPVAIYSQEEIESTASKA